MNDQATVRSDAKELELLSFRVGEQEYSVDIMSVREIRGWTKTTILPHAQPYVKGVINLRGSVVPVVDLSERLGLGTTDPGPRHVIIITVLGQRTVGLLADVVSDILTVAEADIQPIPEIVDDAVRRFISGVLVLDERMIRKMDLAMIIPTESKSAA